MITRATKSLVGLGNSDRVPKMRFYNASESLHESALWSSCWRDELNQYPDSTLRKGDTRVGRDDDDNAHGKTSRPGKGDSRGRYVR
jgi:hypothetical protein